MDLFEIEKKLAIVKCHKFNTVAISVDELEGLLKLSSRYDHLQQCNKRLPTIYPDLDKLFHHSINEDVLGEL